jgi:hypothetical protein
MICRASVPFLLILGGFSQLIDLLGAWHDFFLKEGALSRVDLEIGG